MGRLNPQDVVAHLDQVLHKIGAEHPLNDFGAKSLTAVDVDGVGARGHEHFPVLCARGGVPHHPGAVALAVGFAALYLHVGEIGLAQEAVHKPVLWVVVELQGRAGLLDISHVHHQHPV